MPRRGTRIPEKSKDFKGSIKRLFLSLEKWRYLLIAALVLAMISAIISLIAPNRLSDFTDVITEGLVPNISEKTITEIMADPNISIEDKNKTGEILSSINDELSNEDKLAKIDALPDSVYEKIKPSIDMDEVKRIALLLLILYLTSTIFNYIQSFSMATISNNFAKTLRSKIISKINTLPLKYFDKHETGNVL